MRRTKEQESVNEQIWSLFTHGQTNTALALGVESLRENPSEMNATFQCHVAMQLVDIHKRLAKDATRLREVANHWIAILSLIRNYYPIAATEKEAAEKNAQWGDVLPGEIAQIHAWGGCVDEIILMGLVVASTELLSFSNALLRLILRTQKEGNVGRIMQIQAIKNGTYKEAVDAFERFVAEYGVGSSAGMPDQQIQLASIMLGRARWHGDKKTQKMASQLLSQLRSQSTLAGNENIQALLAHNLPISYVPFLPSLQRMQRALPLASSFLVGNAREEVGQIRQAGKELNGMWIGVTSGAVEQVRF